VRAPQRFTGLLGLCAFLSLRSHASVMSLTTMWLGPSYRQNQRAGQQFAQTEIKENKTVPAFQASTLLTPAEVAAAFKVDPKTVTRWAKAGKLNSIRTLGGHRRYLEAEVLSKLENSFAEEDSPVWLDSSDAPSPLP
jgi:excisionase family DNA binding protein